MLCVCVCVCVCGIMVIAIRVMSPTKPLTCPPAGSRVFVIPPSPPLSTIEQVIEAANFPLTSPFSHIVEQLALSLVLLMLLLLLLFWVSGGGGAGLVA